MNPKTKLGGHLKHFLRWPLIFCVMFFVCDLFLYRINKIAGMLGSLFCLAMLGIALFLYYYMRPMILRELVTFAAEYGQVQKTLLQELDLPYVLLDMSGKILWMNRKFSLLSGKDKNYHKSIAAVIPELSIEHLPKDLQELEIRVNIGERDYRCQLKKIRMDDLVDAANTMELDYQDISVIALFLFDETELNTYMRKCENEAMVAGLLYLDNYYEAMQTVEEVRRSLLIALVERKINQYFTDIGGLVRKFETDKYIVIMRYDSFMELKQRHFDLLEEVKTINTGNEMALTISMGIGTNAGSFLKNSEFSKSAIDLALGRGGDQVVIKDGERIQYYGGKSQAVEKNTRVKARVKAHALRELMESQDKIVVMGHKLTDADAFGAAIGIYRAAKSLNKKVFLVIDNPNKSILPLLAGFRESYEYDKGMFVNCMEARELVDNRTLVVVVDTSKPSYTVCEDILYKTNSIVVLDHHRQGNEVVQNASLSYIEPYASSACEMVAEILQYFTDNTRIRNIEADSMYAGIMIDTDNFTQKTGVRTFEAAAFLRRMGADVTRVRKLFRENMDDYKARGEAIYNAELFLDSFAISECPAGSLENPTVVGAQAANELLNIVGVKASFVLTDYKGMVYISARAIDEVNVQIVMERLGGGGHLNMAGCQFDALNVEEAKNLLKETLLEMKKGGEI